MKEGPFFYEQVNIKPTMMLDFIVDLGPNSLYYGEIAEGKTKHKPKSRGKCIVYQIDEKVLTEGYLEGHFVGVYRMICLNSDGYCVVVTNNQTKKHYCKRPSFRFYGYEVNSDVKIGTKLYNTDGSKFVGGHSDNYQANGRAQRTFIDGTKNEGFWFKNKFLFPFTCEYWSDLIQVPLSYEIIEEVKSNFETKISIETEFLKLLSDIKLISFDLKMIHDEFERHTTFESTEYDDGAKQWLFVLNQLKQAHEIYDQQKDLIAENEIRDRLFFLNTEINKANTNIEIYLT